MRRILSASRYRLILALAALLGPLGLSGQKDADPLKAFNSSPEAFERLPVRFQAEGSSREQLQASCLGFLSRYYASTFFAAADWRPAEALRSPGGWHLQFDQLYLGRPITGRGVKFNLDANGRAVSILASVYAPNADAGRLAEMPQNELSAETIERNAVENYGGHVIENEAAWMLDSLGQLAPARRVLTFEDRKGGSHELWYDPRSGQLLRALPRWSHFMPEGTDGTGRVFKPDPVTSGGVYYRKGTMYADNGNTNNSFFDQQYVEVPLRDLEFRNNAYHLAGPFVRIEDISAPSYSNVVSGTGKFFYDRSQTGFEQVSAYYHIDTFQRYVQSLDFNQLWNKPLRVDAHGFRDDNSAFFPGNANATSYILMGEGGVDDAEDADVLIHEYLHALSDDAAPRTRNGTERRGLDEGFGDYFAASWSRARQEYRWQDLFTWDGHNEFWPGRSANYSRMNYGEMKDRSTDIYLFGQLWATALMQVWNEAGREATDRLALQSLYMSQSNMTLREAAYAIIAADTLLYQGRYTIALQRAFCETGIFEGQVCEALSVAPRRTQPDLRLHPNPASDHFFLEAETLHGFGPLELKIFDLTGRELNTTFLYGNRTRIDAGHLKPGVYLIQVLRNGLPMWNEKLIVHN